MRATKKLVVAMLGGQIVAAFWRFGLLVIAKRGFGLSCVLPRAILTLSSVDLV